jgi:hypothetical protein
MRKSWFFCLFFIFLSFAGNAQRDGFVDNIKGVENKIDTVPYFMYEKMEFDSLLFWTTVLPREADMFGVNCNVQLTFRVDTQGVIKEIIIIDCKPRLIKVSLLKITMQCSRSIRVFVFRPNLLLRILMAYGN